MKKILARVFLFTVILLVAVFIGLYSWIGYSLRENISEVQTKYPGNAEDALIAFLLDSANSYQDRTHIAIWTLGQIKSEKAVPVLEQLYKNDPEGKTCKDHHEEMLCQYEIYKALHAAKVNWLPLHSHLNK
jgi:hypothetical protein